MLTTKGFNGTVLVSTSDLQRRTVIIYNVPPYVDVDTLECPGGFLWLRRHMVGNIPKSQLLGAVAGEVPKEVLVDGTGWRRVALYIPEPDLCQHCSKWGHKTWRCRASFHPAASVPAGTHTMSALIKSRRVTRCPRGAATVVGPIMPTPMSAPRSLDTTGPTLCRRPRYSHPLPLSHMHQLHLQQPLHGILYQHRVTFHHSPAPRLCHLCPTQLPALLHRPLTPHHNLYFPVPILQLPPPINL